MWNMEWSALSVRIASLIEAGTYFIRTIATGENDHYSITDELMRNAKDVVLRLYRLQENYGAQLPQPARVCLCQFITQYNGLFRNVAGGLPATQGALTLLASFRSEFSYLLTDTDAVGQSLVVRASMHLQRSIVADPSVKESWNRAFSQGETACERLGATHLLLHGVWAFKASEAGERTDLVLGVPLSVNNEVLTSAATLVLTEWKVVRAKTELNEKAQQAHYQAQRYSSGILAGFELSSRRYLVIVSSDWLAIPSSFQEGWDNPAMDIYNDLDPRRKS
jgi:hypothetical protein